MQGFEESGHSAGKASRRQIIARWDAAIKERVERPFWSLFQELPGHLKCSDGVWCHPRETDHLSATLSAQQWTCVRLVQLLWIRWAQGTRPLPVLKALIVHGLAGWFNTLSSFRWVKWQESVYLTQLLSDCFENYKGNQQISLLMHSCSSLYPLLAPQRTTGKMDNGLVLKS